MALINRNIWTIFYVLVFFAVIGLSIVVFDVKKSVQNDYITEQENLTKLTANSIHSILIQYEMLLDILGQQLVENENYQSLEKSRIILDNLLKLNPTIEAFGLAKPNGQLYITSSNLKNIKTLPNLSQKEETKDSFEQTLQSSSMVLGRTYYHKVLKTFVIPIRKTIKNKDNEIIAVMTAGINTSKAFKLFGKKDFVSYLFRDVDYYNQLTDERGVYRKQLYSQPIPIRFVEQLTFLAEQKYKQNIQTLKQNEMVFTIEHEKITNKQTVYSSIQFIKRYDLWVVTQVPTQLITSTVLTQSSINVMLFFITMVVLFYLFKYIHSFEKRKQKALEYQANHDYLTNLNNRLYLSKLFESNQTMAPYSLFFIDMDNFKSINDNYGHEYGDKILKEISHRLLTFKKENNYLIRYSGDEFMLISHMTQKDEVKILAQKIIERLSEPYSIEQYQFMLGASIGIAQYPLDGNSFDETKRYADIAMYESKKEHNTFTVFEDTIKHSYLKQSLMEQELKLALHHDEIYMMYQPQVSATGALYGVEALVRWENRKLGFVPPDQFVKVAESMGLMGKIGNFIMHTSLHEIKEVQEVTHLSFQLSINISVKQFMEKEFFKTLMKLLKKSQFEKVKLTLEVTENVFIEDVKFIINLLNKIKKESIKISLDDFGTGYSSLSLLRQLPIDELKIDKTFVDDILEDESANNMVQSVISIGQKLHLILLAEGVETLEQKELLSSYGCELFQGYYYSKPLKKEDLITYITQTQNSHEYS